MLVTALVAALQADLRLNTAAAAIEPAGRGYVVVTAAGERLAADAVILATTANVSARLLATVAPEAAATLRHHAPQPYRHGVSCLPRR